jgi:protocatechuate 3,4-dioxygenase beta subunit
VQALFISSSFAGSIGGKVLSGNVGTANPVEGALVEAIGYNPSGDSLLFSTTSDSGGNYLLDNVSAGVYVLQCSHPNFNTTRKGHVYVSDSSAMTINLFLAPKQTHNSISGAVKNSSTNNPVPNAMVKLSNENNSYSKYTSNNGNYSFWHIANGTYTLTAEAYNYVDYTHAEPIVVEDSTVISGLEILLAPVQANSSLSGVVTDSSTGNPIVGAEVSVYRNHHGSTYSGTTDSLGYYIIENIFGGEYNVKCKAAGYVHFWSEVEIDGATTLDIQLLGLQEGTISGVVTKDDSGEPIANAYLYAIPASGNPGTTNHYYGRAISDSDGNYSMPVRAGNYYVICYTEWNAGYYYYEFYDNVHTIAEATEIAVADDQTVENINFGAPSPSTLEIVVMGKVTDAFNNPIEGANVRAWSHRRCSNDSTWATTDANGDYSISFSSNRPWIRFSVVAKKDGFFKEYYNEKPSWWEADVLKAFNDSTFTNISFTLDSDSATFDNSISGSVTNTNGESLADVTVSAFSRNGGHRRFTTTTDSTGNYTLENLRNGNYILFFFKEDYIPEFYDNVHRWEDATPVNATGTIMGINASLDMDSSGGGNGIITGTIRDANNAPLAGTLVTIKNSFNQVIGYSMTSSDGNYEIEGMNGGNYTVNGSVFGYGSSAQTITFDPIQSNTMIVNMNLTSTPLEVTENGKPIPSEVTLADNYPNPFNPTTVISFSIPEAQYVKLAIYNLLGQKVQELVNEFLPSGNYSASWDATDASGNNVSSGMYLYRLEAGTTTVVKKMLLMK